MNDTVQPALAEGTFVAYTAGSCKGNPGPGGSAYQLRTPAGNVQLHAWKDLSTSNNEAELQAVIGALKACPAEASVLVHLTCTYIKHNFEDSMAGWQANGWQKRDGQEVANVEHWQDLATLAETRKVSFIKIEVGQNRIVKNMAKAEAEAASKEAFCARRDSA